MLPGKASDVWFPGKASDASERLPSLILPVFWTGGIIRAKMPLERAAAVPAAHIFYEADGWSFSAVILWKKGGNRNNGKTTV